ncbi:MAG: HPF/RaiA family ribosome-associated protein [candidate division WOR-3 bacterium]
MKGENEKLPINIYVKNFPTTDVLMQYIHKRLDDLNRFSDLAQHLDIHLEEERGLYKGVGVLKLKGKTLRVEVKNKDPMSVVDEMKDILSREIKKVKDKLTKERRRERGEID